MSRGQRTYLKWEKIGRSRKYLDYGLLCMYESAALIFRGTDSIQLTPLTNTLSWSTFTVFSPISGGKITIPGGSLAVPDGYLVYIRNIEHPIQNSTKSLTAGSPTSRRTRRPTNLFLGGREGNNFYFFPDGSGTAPVPLVLEETPAFPIAEWLDGATPPAALQTLIAGDGRVNVRQFSASAIQKVVLPWEVPADMKIASGLQFKAIGYTTNAAGTPAGLSLKVSGFAIGSGGPLAGTFGSDAEANATITAYSPNTRFETNWSSAIPLSGLSAGDTAMLQFKRDYTDPNDTETNPVGIASILLRYGREY